MLVVYGVEITQWPVACVATLINYNLSPPRSRQPHYHQSDRGLSLRQFKSLSFVTGPDPNGSNSSYQVADVMERELL